ncbi:MAG: tRNA preQ1(34) S-adenosylmethionine ribosyltransferase-isomerase QueA [Nitrospiria bacterium]
MQLSDFDYPFDPALIAVEPKSERDQSRLLVYHRKQDMIEHRDFRAILDYLNPADLLVLNNTRVFPARLTATKENGGKIECLFLRPILDTDAEQERSPLYWEVLVKGKSRPPVDLIFKGGVGGRILRDLEGGRKALRLCFPEERSPDVFAFFEACGEVPLPPYIMKRRDRKNPLSAADQGRYQTVYAEAWGSAAAPTAGLHFTENLIKAIRAKGVDTATTTLHIGLDTFLPIRTERIPDHKMHSEWYQVFEETAAKIHQTRTNKGKVVAVGTTVTRALESAARSDGIVRAAEGYTDIFIRPGHVFNGVDALVTNFHLPKSTLMVMITAFAGFEAVQKIYEEAVRERYRFYSYGDAMLIL